MKRQATAWGKIFVDHVSDRGLEPRIYNILSKLGTVKTKKQWKVD